MSGGSYPNISLKAIIKRRFSLFWWKIRCAVCDIKEALLYLFDGNYAPDLWKFYSATTNVGSIVASAITVEAKVTPVADPIEIDWLADGKKTLMQQNIDNGTTLAMNPTQVMDIEQPPRRETVKKRAKPKTAKKAGKKVAKALPTKKPVKKALKN